jgi:HEAT repeat protein
MPIDFLAIAKVKMAGRSPIEAAQAIRLVLATGSDYEQWLHRDLLLAGWCLTQAPAGLREVDAGLVDEVRDRLVALITKNPLWIGRSIRLQAKEILLNLHADIFGQAVLERLSAVENPIDLCDLIEYQIMLGDAEYGLTSLYQVLEGAQGCFSDRLAAIKLLLKLTNEQAIVSKTIAAQKIIPLIHSKCPDEFIEALGELGDTSPETIDLLFATFERKPSSQMKVATEALIKSGQFNLEILHRLLKLAKHRNWRIRRCVAGWNHESGHIVTPELVQTLIDLTQDEQPIIRYSATASLGSLIHEVPEVVPILLKLTHDTNDDVCRYAIHSLVKLEKTPLEVIDRLMLLATDSDSEKRSDVAIALGNIKSDDARVLSQLLTFMKDDDSHTVNFTIHSLTKLKLRTPKVISLLLDLLDHDQVWLRSTAAGALGELEVSTPEVIEALKVRLYQNDAVFCRVATETLIRLGDFSIEVMDGFLTFLDHESFSYREVFVEDFAGLGQQSHELKEAIVNWLENHPERDATRDAIDLLWSILV